MRKIVGWYKKYSNIHWYAKKSFNTSRKWEVCDKEGIELKYNYHKFNIPNGQETRMHRL